MSDLYHCYVAGKPISGSGKLAVRNPYHKNVVGEVSLATRADVEAAIQAGLAAPRDSTRFSRYEVLERARVTLEERREEFARLITSESGLCLRESRYEVGRASDVLRFAAIEALRDDGQIFSCDVSPQGKARKIFTLREPLKCAVAIT